MTPVLRGARLLPAVLAVGVLAVAPGPGEAQGVGLPVGVELPDFTATDLDGGEVHIHDVVVPGKPAVIEIWATWCAICAALEPTLQEIHGTRGDDVSIVAIAVAVNQTREQVAEHVARVGHAWPVLYDEDGSAVRALEVYGTGIVLLVDRDGRIAGASVGTPEGVRRDVDTLLGGG